MNIESIIKSTVTIPDDRDYWLVRTENGKYFHDFRNNGFIGIGWDDIASEDLLSSEYSYTELEKRIKNYYPDDKRPGRTLQQMIKFTKEIKTGDIVLIPAHQSNLVCFGVVPDNEIYNAGSETASNEVYTCPYQKRRKINWVKMIRKKEIDPNLYGLFYSQHTVSNLSKYQEYIDSTLHTLYLKNGLANFVLHVGQQNNINAQQLFSLGTNTLELLQDIGRQFESPIDLEKLSIKIQLQSKGKIQLVTGTLAIVAFAVFGILLVGGNLNVKNKGLQIDVNTPGFMKQLNDFQNDSTDRQIKMKLLEQQLKSFEIEDRGEIKKVLKQLIDESGRL